MDAHERSLSHVWDRLLLPRRGLHSILLPFVAPAVRQRDRPGADYCSLRISSQPANPPTSHRIVYLNVPA
jgi:hypothetical protein